MDITFNYLGIWGGLLGAYFGFVFFRLGQDLVERAIRIKAIKVNLAKVLYLLNEVRSIVKDSKLDLQRLQDELKGQFALTKFSFEEIPRIPIDVVIDIRNQELMNTLYELNVSIRIANHNLYIFSDAYDEVKNSYLSKRISDLDAMVNIRKMVGDHQPIIDQHLDKVINNVDNIFSEIRARLKRLKKRKYFTRGTEPTPEGILEESNSLKKELNK